MNKITAKIICDSINQNGNRLTTYELSYPRIIHSEFLTHRQLSRNAASSRAIPFDKMLQQLEGIPSRFGAAQKGMQDNGEEFNAPIIWHDDEWNEYKSKPEEAWQLALNDAICWSGLFKEAGYHKQIYNRLTEPFQLIKVVASATEWSNFFWLRDDVMADPTIAELARKMKLAYDESIPQLLKAGELHLPYVQTYYFEDDGQRFIVEDSEGVGYYVTTEQAIKVSAARCAAVSYRSVDYGLEKCEEIYHRLVTDERVHASALEHQCSPIPLGSTLDTEGVTALHKHLGLMSGNLAGWLQHRQFIKGNTKYDFD